MGSVLLELRKIRNGRARIMDHPRLRVRKETGILILLFLALYPHIPATAEQAQTKPESHTSARTSGQRQLQRKIVRAPWLMRLVQSGSPVSLSNAVIHGRLDLSYRVIEQQISLTDCDFEEAPDFSYSTFKKHLVLEGSTFSKGATFQSTIVNLNFNLRATSFFGGEVFLKDLQVHGRLDMHNTQLASGVTLLAENVHIDKVADFSNAIFGAKTDLSGTEILSDLFFTGAKFQMALILTGAKIANSLFLTDAQFKGLAGFAGMHVAYNVRAERAVFEDGANFTDAQIGSFIDLTGTRFGSRKQPAHFARATVAAGAYFNNVQFVGGGEFDGAHFIADATFDGVVFERPVAFDRARFDQSAHFEQTLFKENVSFQETFFSSLHLSPDGRVNGHDQFGGLVDLLGCTYDRVRVRWQSLLTMPDGKSRLIGVDKQPYFQLQKAYAAAGDDVDANQVLLQWHRVQRQEMFRTAKWRWLIDCVPWLTTNYGVASARLLYLSAVLLLFGMLVFSRPGAVFASSNNHKTVKENSVRLQHWDALAVSFHQFLPLEVPFGSEWTPATDPVTLRFGHRGKTFTLFRMHPSVYATILKISGYILVPLEILVLNGLLRTGS